LTTVVMESAAQRYSGAASGINNATARVAGMLAVALLGAVAISMFRTDVSERLIDARVPQQLSMAVEAQVAKLAEAKAPAARDDNERQLLTRILHESFVRSFRVVMLLTSGLAL